MTFLANTDITSLYESIATYLSRKLHGSKTEAMNLKANIFNGMELQESNVPLKTSLSQFLSDQNRRLEFPRHEIPLVSIIIITYNKSEYTFQCLKSLLSIADVPYELIIVDNASRDETVLLLERLTNASVVQNTENVDFLHACNQAAPRAKGKYLLFLNNDAYLTHGALSGLVDTIERVPTTGAVGAKLVRPSGQLQEAGSIIWKDGSALGYGRGDDPDKGEYSYLREVDYCSAACLLVRRELFERLGGFDRRYLPAYYEDSDLCMGLRDLGYRVLFQPKAVVMHHEFTSSSPGRAEALCRQNQPKFEAKWRRALMAHLPPSPANILRARDRGMGRRVIVFDDRIPTPDRGSGFPRMLSMLQLLAEMDYKVTFVPVGDTARWQPETEELQQLGIEVLYGQLKLADLLENRKALYPMVLISRPHNAAAVMPLVCKFLPGATLIYDAEALFYQRDVLRAQLEGRRTDSKEISRLKEEELEWIGMTDKVITVSQREKELVTRETGRCHGLFVWGHLHQPHVPSTRFSDRKDILFVGGFLTSPSPNEDAIIHFARHIFPGIRQELTDVRLIVVGANPPKAVASLASEAVVIQGYVPSLQEYYESCRLFIVPLRYGAGISHKLTEAMSFGIPAVVTEVAANGLDLQDGAQALICHDDQEFAKKTIQLYRDESLWIKVQQGALTYIAASCGPHRMKESLRHIFECSNDGTDSTRSAIAAARLRIVQSKAAEALLPRSRTPWYRLPARALYYYQEAGPRMVLSKTYQCLRTRLPRGSHGLP